MSPWEYAQRYLPVEIPGPTAPIKVEIRRYRLGAPKPAKDQLLGRVSDHFAKHAKDKAYRLRLTINGQTEEFANWHELGFFLQAPFIGKGSPEDCQLVLQLALLTGYKTPGELQGWADENLGLDCNGFVGNYLHRHLQGKAWRAVPPKGEVGPSTTIDGFWQHWVDKPIDDLSQIKPNQTHLIVRADSAGKVIPQWSGSTPAHIAITQAGESMNHSFVTDSMGGYDLGWARDGMYNKLALKTVESGGPVNGVGQNWFVFVEPTKIKGVFKVNRDKLHRPSWNLDVIRIGTLRGSPS
jgi:hypothetical protein